MHEPRLMLLLRAIYWYRTLSVHKTDNRTRHRWSPWPSPIVCLTIATARHTSRSYNFKPDRTVTMFNSARYVPQPSNGKILRKSDAGVALRPSANRKPLPAAEGETSWVHRRVSSGAASALHPVKGASGQLACCMSTAGVPPYIPIAHSFCGVSFSCHDCLRPHSEFPAAISSFASLVTMIFTYQPVRFWHCEGPLF